MSAEPGSGRRDSTRSAGEEPGPAGEGTESGARDDLVRRGQDAGAGPARRGHGTRDEVMRQLEALEDRLASVEELLRRRLDRSGDLEGEGHEDETQPNREVEG